MPELPEVETIARQLRARGVVGRRIVSVQVEWPRTVDPVSVDEFVKALCGFQIELVTRTGKWLMFGLDSGQTIMVHLRMSGAFSLKPSAHDRIILELSDDLMLYFSDPRKFGRWKLVNDPRVVLNALGPDALTAQFTLNGFREKLVRCQRKIKPLLLDQSIVSGLGNIYADEALWEACIHPERISKELSDSEIKVLYESIRKVLRTGVENRGTSLGDGKSNYRDLEGRSGEHREEVKVYGRSGGPCVRCGAQLQKIKLAQRGTHFCTTCQKP